MKTRLILAAFLKLKNLAVLLVLLGISVWVGKFSEGSMSPLLSRAGDIAYVASVVIYLAVVFKTLSSKNFHEEFNHKQKVKHIQDLNYAAWKLFSQARKHADNVYMQRLKRVMEDKDDIVDSFFRGERSFLREKIVEQTLNLVVSYIKLLMNFCIRSRELSGVNIGDITNRINTNLRKLNFISEPNIIEDMKKAIEMDEKLLGRLKEEKRELERVDAKLNYMETMVSMFKHQILSSVETEEMLEKLETAVNEAAALDSVLEERRKRSIMI